jgi:hypothetical protein
MPACLMRERRSMLDSNSVSKRKKGQAAPGKPRIVSNLHPQNCGGFAKAVAE